MLSPRIMSDISLESTNYGISSLACGGKTGQRREHVKGPVPWKWSLSKFSFTQGCWALNQVKSYPSIPSPPQSIWETFDCRTVFNLFLIIIFYSSLSIVGPPGKSAYEWVILVLCSRLWVKNITKNLLSSVPVFQHEEINFNKQGSVQKPLLWVNQGWQLNRTQWNIDLVMQLQGLLNRAELLFNHQIYFTSINQQLIIAPQIRGPGTFSQRKKKYEKEAKSSMCDTLGKSPIVTYSSHSSSVMKCYLFSHLNNWMNAWLLK